MDKDWFDGLQATDPIKQQAEGYLSKVNVEEVADIIKADFAELLKRAADQKIIILDARTIDEKKWLNLATKRGALAVVKELLDRGANIEVKDNYGSTPLHVAAGIGHLEVFKELLERGADIRNAGSTTLHLAAHPGVVKELLYRGVTIEVRDKFGRTPLHMVAALGYFDVVKELVESGANVLAKNKKNKTVYDAAVGQEIKDYLKNVMDNFKYPPEKTEEGGKGLEYLKYLVELRKDKPELPPRLLTYWANQTLSGLQYGVRKTYPTKGEMPEILEAIALSASGVPYGSDDRWVAWSIFRNQEGNQDHMKNIYTFIRYAQMRLAGLPDDEIKANLAKDEKARNHITVGTFGNVKAQFDIIIEKYK